MNFYIDFEATQHTNRIISVGCVAGNGAHFYSLVKPVKGKINPFITELTGITSEMLENERTADEVFVNLRDWMMQQIGVEKPIIYAYGSDHEYVQATMETMENLDAYMFAASMKGLMVDYSKTVSKILGKNGIALRRLVAAIEKKESIKQNHNALEDAEWLKLVAENIYQLAGTEALPEVAKKKLPKAVETSGVISTGELPTLVFHNLPREPENINVWQNFRGGHHWEVPHDGDKENWAVRAWNDKHEIFFEDVETAIFWCTKMLRNTSIKLAKNLSNSWKGMTGNAKAGTKFCGVFWEIKPIKEGE